jgi:hypothetical protein
MYFKILNILKIANDIKMDYCRNVWDFCWDCGYRCIDYVDWFDVLVYVIIFTALYFALYLEYYDLFCPHDGQTCRVGQGAAYEAGKPHENDDVDTLLMKIRISSRYDEASVYWRRTIVFSILLTFTLLTLLFQRLPKALELIISFITIYLFTFLFQVYYQEVVSKPATQQVNEATDMLSN